MDMAGGSCRVFARQQGTLEPLGTCFAFIVTSISHNKEFVRLTIGWLSP